ncbi:hypothetical protein HMPREF1544_11895 [Mucor circinelloides 1006PhL]|uniref:TRP C-terminal domain-containing protein n=1 Tax=Mucor circinelloides f. circinelloides (strain 1006PhL) TaxID=1220926 RepID=S2IUV5_MUCC1|nr:hypothetical protein HMPREF1544_11895 [Mucor circinelloides 1006PhL]
MWFPSTNFTYCYQGEFNVSAVTRYFNVKTSSYHLNFTSTSNTIVNNLNQQGSTSAASMFELRFGFQTFQAPAQQFCPDTSTGCPIQPNRNFSIQRSFNLSDVPLYPLADITAQYSAIDADSKHLVCIRLAPVGYQHPVWQKIFTFLPIGFTVAAAILSLIASFTIFHEGGEHDMFLLSSNYAMLPGVLRLKTPGFFDLVFYAQFIVIAGQFNIDYPRFHALFTSNFSWSFLLFESKWLDDIIHGIFQSSSSSIQDIASIPRYSIYKRQLANAATNGTTHDFNSGVDVAGTGMLDFATASGIDINALFFTFLVYTLIIVGSCALLCFITWAVLYMFGRMQKRERFIVMSQKMWDFSVGILVRIVSLLYLPILTISFYQLMIPSYWYITLSAAVFLVAPFLLYGFISIKLLQIRPASFIYTELKLLLRFGSLYNQFTDDTFHFFLAIIVYKSLMAAMIGLFQTSGLAQLILVIVAEMALTLGMYLKWPYADSQVNAFHVVFGCIKTVVLLLNICYLPSVHASTMSKQYVGYIQMAIHCLAFFIFLLFLIKNLIIIATGLGDDELDETGRPPARMVMWRKRKRSNRPPISSSRLGSSSADLMTMSSRSRSQSASFYMNGDSSNQLRSSNRLTMNSQTLDMLANYYNTSSSNNTSAMNVAVLKPDEIKRQSNPILASASTPPAIAADDSVLAHPAAIRDYHNRSRAGSSASNTITVAIPPPVINTYRAQTHINTSEDDYSHRVTHYRIDDDIVPSSEPLMASINEALQRQSQPSTLTQDRPPPPPLPKHQIKPLPKNDSNISSIYSPPHQASPTSLAIQDEI